MSMFGDVCSSFKVDYTFLVFLGVSYKDFLDYNCMSLNLHALSLTNFYLNILKTCVVIKHFFYEMASLTDHTFATDFSFSLN